MNLFNQPFFNRRNWILENLEELNLTLEESMVVLFIDYFNEFQRNVDIVSLSKKLNMDGEHVDRILNQLIQKGYLRIEAINRRMVYQLDGLYTHTEDAKPCDVNTYKTLFELYEQEFKRPLSQNESQIISEWISKYDLKAIEYALREAVIYEKMSFSYVDKILRDWKEKGFTAKMYEEKYGS